MKSINTERAFSRCRFERYVAACDFDQEKALQLYKANIRLSVKLFAVIGMFEVVFRNAIDQHYRSRYGNNWLLQQAGPDGFFAKKGCEKTRENIIGSILKFGTDFTHDKVVADLGLAFWRNLFAPKEFAAGGSSLLAIFKNKPYGFGFNHTYVFNNLNPVNELRNRVAHHDPVCFAPKTSVISCELPLRVHRAVAEMLYWMDFDPDEILEDIDFVLEEIDLITR